MTTTFHGHCWHCGQELHGPDYDRENHCPRCGKAAHACRNCRFFAPGKANQCEEPMADRVMDKTHANFCGYFEPTTSPRGDGEKSAEDALRQAAEDLFKS